jgi:type IV pilus assembly protein PilA
MKLCPFCAQEIEDDAMRCPACQEDLAPPTPRSAPPQPPSPPPVRLSSAGVPLPPGHMPQAVYVPDADAKTSGMAIGSLIFGVLFVVLPAAVVAIVLGHLSHSQIRKSAGRLKGSGLATAGLILGYLGIAIIPFILIIAAIAIPNLLRSKMAANEASALGSLRRINTACVEYSTLYGGFPPTLAALGGADNLAADPSPKAAKLIDSTLQTGWKYGYVFYYAPGTRDTSGNIVAYTVTADPITHGSTGIRHFFTDQTGVIRVDSRATADADSPPLD